MRGTPERHERAKNLFADLNVPVTFHVAERDPQGPIYGCWRSHLACWEKGLADGHDIIAVFEDDVLIPSRDELQTLMAQAEKALRENTDFTIVVLHNRGVDIGYEPGPIKSGVAITTSAYVIHLPRLFAKGRDKLQPTGRHLDYELMVHRKGPAFLQVGVFEVQPTIAPGAEFGTLNDYGPFINGLFRIFGYAALVDGVGSYVETIGRSSPKWLRPLMAPLNELGSRLLQPKV
jgi:hypothetical protein